MSKNCLKLKELSIFSQILKNIYYLTHRFLGQSVTELAY